MGDQRGGKDRKMEEEATTEYEGEEMARACSPTDREAHRGLPSWQEKEQKSAAPRVGAGRGGGAAVAATAMTSAPSPALLGRSTKLLYRLQHFLHRGVESAVAHHSEQ